MKRNIALILNKETIRKGKLLAAKRETFIGELLAESLGNAVGKEEEGGYRLGESIGNAWIFVTDKVFVDTNILVCAHELDAGEKHRIARDLMVEMWEKQFGVLSTQVLFP